jgi:hypothetical protein
LAKQRGDRFAELEERSVNAPYGSCGFNSSIEVLLYPLSREMWSHDANRPFSRTLVPTVKEKSGLRVGRVLK